MKKISKMILTDIGISWRVDYDEKGEACGKHVAFIANCIENVPNGKRIAGQVIMSESIFTRCVNDPDLCQKWMFAEIKHLWMGLAMKSNDLGIDIDVSEVYTPMIQKFFEGFERFSQNEMPWFHVFYLVRTLKPGNKWIHADGTTEEIKEEIVAIVKAD